MSRAAVVMLVLVAAALAGCTSGVEGPQAQTSGQEAQDQGSPERPGPRGPGRSDSPGNEGWRGDLRLDVDPQQGLAPLNVTIHYDVGGRDHPGRGQPGNGTGAGRGNGPDGNSTGAPTGNSTGNATGNATGNSTAGNGTMAHPNANLTWTLALWRMQPHEVEAEGNATGNATGRAGNATGPSGGTGNATGNATGNPAGSSTGNSTGNATSGSDRSRNETSGDSGAAHGPGNLTLVVNGTWADLPGTTMQTINATGHYKVRLMVDYGNGTVANRTAVIHVRGLQDGDALGNETREFAGSFFASEPLLCLLGAEEFEWILNDTFGGHRASASRLNATLEAEGSVEDYTLTLVAPNGTDLASGPSLEVAGPLEAGNYTLRVESCVAFDAAFTVTGVVDYVFAAPPATTRPEAAAG